MTVVESSGDEFVVELDVRGHRGTLFFRIAPSGLIEARHTAAIALNGEAALAEANLINRYGKVIKDDKDANLDSERFVRVVVRDASADLIYVGAPPTTPEGRFEYQFELGHLLAPLKESSLFGQRVE